MSKKTERSENILGFWFKPLSSGNKTIYLRIPMNDSKGIYMYENLKLYLIPENNAASKKQNKKTLKIAETLRVQRTVEYLEGKVTRKDNSKKNILLIDWMVEFAKRKEMLGQSKSNAITVSNVRLHLMKYMKKSITMKQIDKDFCEGFLLYLANGKTIGTDNPKTGQHHEKPIAKSTARLYFNTFVTALNEAVRDGIMEDNPANKLKREEKRPIRPEENSRGYLEIGEIKKMIDIPCENDNVKYAFLFACFCGLRLSDIKELKWEDIKKSNGTYIISKVQVKTKRKVNIPLSESAMKWLPSKEDAKPQDYIFFLPSHFSVNRYVKKWAKNAGICKNVTFHMSRHTFATTLISLGADIYTTSKLLGHQNIRTTQIYAEIVDKKKEETINLMNGLFDDK